jgi:lipopolysaccharide transport system permease protein
MAQFAQMAPSRVLELDTRPDTRRAWVADLRRHLDVLTVLARKDFQTRYKRASLGLSWAVVVPVLQGAIMALIFSRVIKSAGGPGYGAYVMSGMFAYTYFSQTLGSSVTAIVDGSSMSDKVWFPRILLVAVPAIANLVGLVVTFGFLMAIMPLLGAHYSTHLLLLLPALLLLVFFTFSLSLLLSALHVYYRDVKFLVQAALMVWMYLTPVIYPISLLRRFSSLLGGVVMANPVTGIVSLVHVAVMGTSRGPLLVPVLVSLGGTVVLAVAGTEAQRRYDRLFVDLL